MNTIPLNDGWIFYQQVSEAFPMGQRGPGERVRLPHTNAELPLSYGNPEAYQFLSGYERPLPPGMMPEGGRAFVCFDGAAHQAAVYLNGAQVATHSCGYTAFRVELTEHWKKQGENILSVRLDSRETLDQPPFGGVIDYLTYGGLYREAALEITGQTYLADVFAATPKEDLLRLDITLDGPAVPDGRICLTLAPPRGEALLRREYPLAGERTRLEERITGARPWSPDSPALYELKVVLCNAAGKALDETNLRMGFRQAEFRRDGFYLNGEKLRIRGLNRHQSYPYIGYAAPAALQRFDAEVLKNELGLNAVRTSHYPQSQHFINRCDELGLMVFTEIPGWQHVGGEQWKNIAVETTAEMVRQYRSHPSVILWGVRVNESQDDDVFYARTNAAARAWDDTRQTGGVRYLEKSSLLEDVYTYNDFSHTGNNPGLRKKKAVTPDCAKAYLVTEYNGHMYPTKSGDSEAHRLSHALRHANVLGAMYAESDVAGCFGWCMADYPTHWDFGSGDGVCHHGVLDVFRNPKLAAAVYGSQAEEGCTLAVSSSMDIGEHPAGNLGDVWAFTNADSLRLYKNGAFVKEFYPNRKAYPHLPHAPIKIDDRIGCLLERQEGMRPFVAAAAAKCLNAVERHGFSALPLRFKLTLARLMAFHGFTMADGARLYGKYVGGWGGKSMSWRFDAVKNGKVTASVEKRAEKRPRLWAQASHTDLTEGETYDMALVRIRIVDEWGNVLPYYQGALALEARGAVALVGPEHVGVQGGMGGTFVKTTGAAGEGSLTIRGDGLEPFTLPFGVKLG